MKCESTKRGESAELYLEVGGHAAEHRTSIDMDAHGGTREGDTVWILPTGLKYSFVYIFFILSFFHHATLARDIDALLSLFYNHIFIQ